MVESDTRNAIRGRLRTQTEVLQKNLSQACIDISKQTKKEVLIIIDDLDKLDTKFAEQIFFKDSQLLTLLETKVIFTFPLDTYYDAQYLKFKDSYEPLFISLVNLSDYEGNYQEDSLEKLKRLVYMRIDENIITETALKSLVDKSGGLLRDLIKFMQDACMMAIKTKSEIIDNTVSEQVINSLKIDYYRLFDFPKYEDKVKEIMHNRDIKIDNEILMYLLRYLFVLEYRHKDKLWYDAHPCLKDVIKD